ncbi:MAG: hypothetical protein EPN86_00300 [Nanoarchaeota archaeon]|nr:MAG: hypothetical protein EPN86_00300 [Nanoarchaeota archaeon]
MKDIKEFLERNPIRIIIGAYVLNALLIFLPPLLLLRIITGLFLLFVVPGYFIAGIMFRSHRIDSLERAFIIGVSSVASNIAWALFLNWAVKIPFSTISILAMNLALTVTIGLADYVVARYRGTKEYI